MSVKPDQAQLRDRDTKHTTSFDAVFTAEDTHILLSAPRTPKMNAHCERAIGAIRRVALDHRIADVCADEQCGLASFTAGLITDLDAVVFEDDDRRDELIHITEEDTVLFSQGRSTVFPTVARAVIAVCAADAPASGNRCPTSGRSRPSAAAVSASRVWRICTSGARSPVGGPK